MAVKVARLTALLVTTGAIAVGAAVMAADQRADSELRRFVAFHPGLTVKSIRIDPFGGPLVLRGIEVGRGPAGHVAIGRLTLAPTPISLDLVSSARAESASDPAVRAAPGADVPAPRAGTGAAIPGTATAENVVFSRGTTVVRIKRIDLTGTSLSNAELARLLDPNSGESFEARLRKVSATSIIVPEIISDDPTAGSEEHVVLSQISLSGVKAGKATAVAIGGVGFTSHTGEETTRGTVGATQAFGVDFAQTAHVFGTVRRDDAEPTLPLYDSVTVDGMKTSDGKGGSFTVASLKEIGVKARPLRTDVFAAINAGQKMSKPEETALLQDMSHSFEIGSMEVTDVAVRGVDPKDPLAFTLASVAMRGFSRGKIGGFGLRGMRFATSTVKLGLEKAEFGPFELPQGDVGRSGSANAMMSSAGKADLDKLDVDVTTKDAATGDQRVKFTIAHSGFSSEGVPGELPIKAKASFDHVVFDLPADPGQAKPLVDMGYRHLDLSGSLATTYDGDNQELTIRDLRLEGVDMGSLALGLHLLNVTKGVISPKQEVQKASLLAILVNELTVDVANKGLVDRAVAWKAKQDGMSVDAERASIIDFLSKTLPAQINSANVRIVGDAIAKFIAAPRTLHIGILSKSGIGAGSMALLSDPVLLIDTLDVNARAD